MSQTQFSNSGSVPDANAGDVDDVQDPPAGEGAEEGTSEDGQDGGADDEERAFQERLARDRGWRSADEWKGERPKNFIEDPVEFNRVHEQHNHRLRQENAELRRDVDEIKQMSQQSFKMLRESKDAEIERLKSDADRRMREAVEKADSVAFNDAKKDYDALSSVRSDREEGQGSPASAPTYTPPADYNPDNDPHFKNWHAQNPWYGTDQARTNYANKVAVAELKAQNIAPHHGRLFYDKVSEIIERDLGPVQRPRRNGANQAQAGDAPQSRGRKNFDAIPAEDKDQFRKVLVKKLGVYKDDDKGRAEYAKSYWHEKENQILR